MSGLFLSYLLRDLNPLLLEQAERFGGNSKAQAWNGIDYSLGAAYIGAPERGTPLAKLYEEIGLLELGKLAPEAEPVMVGKKLMASVWESDPDPATLSQLKKAEKLFRQIYEGERPYPVIPPTNAAEEKVLRAYDRDSFFQFLERELGKLQPRLETFFELYSWSAAGAPMRELSAALGISFFAAEFGSIFAPRGGNAAIAERLFERIAATNGMSRLRPSCLVVNVETKKDRSFVSYEQSDGTLRTITAKAVVMACPKFVAKKVIEGLEPDRLKAMNQVRSYGYLVANVFLNSPAPKNIYDLYLLPENSQEKPNSSLATDLVNATYANPMPEKSVLTLYRPLPHAGARAELMEPSNHDRFMREICAQLENILSPLGLNPAAIQGIHLTRWGHPIPIAFPGFYRQGLAQKLRQPFRERVFFVEQDNWAAPAIETCAGEAMHWAPKIRHLLGR